MCLYDVVGSFRDNEDNLRILRTVKSHLNNGSIAVISVMNMELTEIIAQYLQLAGLLCFNTKADMKNAENLVNGSFAKTYGTTTYNDGLGEFYKIREILNTDVVDDNNIIALTNYNNLIAACIDEGYEDIAKVIKHINEEENIHVGMLQHAMTTISE